MAYVTKDDLIKRFGQEELPELSGGGDDDDRINALIAQTDAEVDSYLRSGGYPVTVRGKAASEIKGFVADMVRYRIADDQSNLSDNIEARFKDARDWFSKIAKREIVLDCGQYSDSKNKLSSMSVRRT